MDAAYAAAEAKVFARDALEPRRHILALDEPALHIRALEFGSGEPVLFLHGFSLCSAYWASLIAPLHAYRCITLDMPGHGGSDSVNFDGVDLRSWSVKMLTGCLDRLGLEAVHVVGHSQ